jgi:hypothetical protein
VILERKSPDFVKAVALAISAVALLVWGYHAVARLIAARSEGHARSALQMQIHDDGLKFGRFLDFGRGNQCLEFTILHGGHTIRYGAAQFSPRADRSTEPVLRQISPSFEECKIGAAG